MDTLLPETTQTMPSITHLIASTAARALDRVGLLDLMMRRTPRRYIMAYHRVLPPAQARAEWCHPAMWISPATMREHFALFQRVGRIVPLDELLAARESRQPLFSITFDDAWADNYDYALELLNQFGVRACFFVPTDAVTSGELFWTEDAAQKLGDLLLSPMREAFVKFMGWDEVRASTGYELLLRRLMQLIEDMKLLPAAQRQARLAELYDRFGAQSAPIRGRIMNWSQIRELAHAGHEIGSHSRTHTILQNIELDIVDNELRSSKQEIERQLGREIRYFCYPNARYDDVSVPRVLAAGYTHGFRMHNLPVTAGCANELIPRFSASEENASRSKLKARFLRAAHA
jgi:peptidoglycan/xylan/chitin deacetylase (PgdA/CDA1 family)